MKFRTLGILTLILATAEAFGIEPMPKAFPDDCMCSEETIVAELMAGSSAGPRVIQSTLSPLEMNAAYTGASQKLQTTTKKVTNNAVSPHRQQVEKSTGERVGTYFAWGGDMGSSIDLSGNDMSSFDFNMSFGIRHGWLNFLGLGVGADIAVTNSTRAYPFFLEFRTNFTNKPTVCFWQLRLGASYNMLEHNHKQLGIYGTTGIGFNLARSRKFCSHIIVGYTYRQRNRVVGTEMTHEFTDLHYASVKLGVTF